MSIERIQPAEIFKTTDGRLFDNQEEAHCHERHTLLQKLVFDYQAEKKKTGAVVSTTIVFDLAVQIACIVRATPLANA